MIVDLLNNIRKIMATSPRSAAIRDWGSPMTPGVRVVKREPKKISIYLSIYLYCVTLIAEYYAQGCRRWRKARAYLDIPGIYMWNHRCRKATAKPHTLRRMFCFFFFFFLYKYFVVGWTWTRTEEVHAAR